MAEALVEKTCGSKGYIHITLKSGETGCREVLAESRKWYCPG
jgi:hypothetical protein